jgi:hypothetical protein
MYGAPDAATGRLTALTNNNDYDDDDPHIARQPVIHGAALRRLSIQSISRFEILAHASYVSAISLVKTRTSPWDAPNQWIEVLCV